MAESAPSRRTVLALNCGSSSLKFGLYDADEESAHLLFEGEAEEIGGSHARFWYQPVGEPKREEQGIKSLSDHKAALSYSFDVLERCRTAKPDAIGHRFVHGGPELLDHTLLTEAVQQKLLAARMYAPLHLPAALSVLQEASRLFGALPQAICLDTAFHRHMPEVSRTYALPKSVRQKGVQRYGFHGLSLESIVAQCPVVPKRTVVAHLGNGSSISALLDGVSVDTSMGMTPTGGVMMGTRTGDLDPGVLIHLTRNGYAVPEELESLVDHQSGLLGVSDVSSDVRELVAARKTNPAADLALRMFSYQVRKTIAAMAAALGGLNLLVFTGGIGEHSGEVRAEICQELSFLGPIKIQVLPSKEDEQIAKNTARLVANHQRNG